MLNSDAFDVSRGVTQVTAHDSHETKGSGSTQQLPPVTQDVYNTSRNDQANQCRGNIEAAATPPAPGAKHVFATEGQVSPQRQRVDDASQRTASEKFFDYVLNLPNFLYAPLMFSCLPCMLCCPSLGVACGVLDDEDSEDYRPCGCCWGSDDY